MAQQSFDLGSLVATCIDLAKYSGKVISGVYQSGNLGVVDKVYGSSKKLNSIQEILSVKDPQTAADELAQKLIIGSLQKIYPTLKICGEEGDLKYDDSDIVTPNTKWDSDKDGIIPKKYESINIKDLIVWVDPVDGTKEFTEGIKEAVTTLIGIAWKGRPIAGVIGRPFTEEVIYGIVGLGAFGFRNKDELKERMSNKNKLRRIICTSRSHFQPSMKAYVSACKPSGFKRTGGSGGKVLMVIEGEADAYVFPSHGTKKWDTCAPEAILLSLGGHLTKPNGELYDYDPMNTKAMNEEGFIATVFGSDYHETFLEKNLHICQLDVVLFGATGFTGGLAIEYIVDEYIYKRKNNHNNEKKLNFGIAGRSKIKLDNVLYSIKSMAKYSDDDIKKEIDQRITIIECDAFNLKSVESMIQKTSVIINTVGPYAIYGENIIRACCKYGVDYVDLTGEFPWVKRMILKYDADAKRSHARIVNFGGCVAALTDCAIYSGIERLKGLNDEKDEIEIKSITPGIIVGRGAGSSGGTIASWLHSVEDGAWKYDQHDAFFLCDSDDYEYQQATKQPKYNLIQNKYDDSLKLYGAPFMYGPLERMVFMRSNELLDYYYGKNVKIYENLMYLKSKIFAILLSLISYIIPLLLAWSCCRSILVKIIRSISFQPGNGPNREKMEKSKWREIIYINAINKTQKNKTLKCQVDIKIYGDYGYLNTAKLLVEQGVICSLERNNPKIKSIDGGFLTPAAAFKNKLSTRLNSQLKQFDISYKMID